MRVIIDEAIIIVFNAGIAFNVKIMNGEMKIFYFSDYSVYLRTDDTNWNYTLEVIVFKMFKISFESNYSYFFST